jgi:hypothetical protein
MTMPLELKFNHKDKTIDLVGRLPAGTKSRVMKVMTYNPILRCYQGAVNKEVLMLACELNATISSDLAKVIMECISSNQMVAKVEKTSTKRQEPDKSEAVAPVGFIMKHSGFGLGRLLKLDGNVTTVHFFFPPSRYQLKLNAISRALIPIETPCETKNGRCIIKKQRRGQDKTPHFYTVEFENGLINELSETELTPIKLIKPRNPLDVLATLQHEGYPIFIKRENLVQAYNALVRRCIGVKSILSSRIDLYPHQAYVAGTVILDSEQRYLLADEVGLGKTIEAGIVIHDLLTRNPLVNILILCPGTLVQQWFSEMYSKFSGVIFRLPELSGFNSMIPEKSHQVILSFNAVLSHPKALIGKQWHLVVIDDGGCQGSCHLSHRLGRLF